MLGIRNHVKIKAKEVFLLLLLLFLLFLLLLLLPFLCPAPFSSPPLLSSSVGFELILAR
jgi:hypothetical protein